MYKKLTLCFLLLLSIFIQSSLAMQDHWRERANPVPVLSVPFYHAPEVCRQPDFVTTCNNRDQACKTRKEKCGDAVGASFNETLLSVENGISRMTVHNGKYDSIHGIDDYRSAEKAGMQFHYFGENKAHTSQLDRRTNQQSNEWDRNRLIRAYNVGNLSYEDYSRGIEALETGKAIRAVSHTTLVSDRQGSQHFQMVFKPIFSNIPERRQAELQTYCTTIHEPIKSYAHQYPHVQTPEQQNNLARLDLECQAVLPSPAPVSLKYDYFDPMGVCYVKRYNRENLHKLLNFLNVRGYTQYSIAQGTLWGIGTIDNLMRSVNYSPTANYQALWNHLESKFSEEFALWTTIP